jgi:hypothetical protein
VTFLRGWGQVVVVEVKGRILGPECLAVERTRSEKIDRLAEGIDVAHPGLRDAAFPA